MIPWWLAAAVVAVVGAAALRWHRRQVRSLRAELAVSRRRRRASSAQAVVTQRLLVQPKVTVSEVERIPRGEGVVWDAHAAAVARRRLELAETEMRARTAMVEAAAETDRVAAGLPVLAAPDVEAFGLSDEPQHTGDELDRLQHLGAFAHHGRVREPADPPPPVQAEPVVPEVEVLEPVEVPEGDDDPPQDEARVASRGGDGPPTGGRSLTPFGVDGRPPSGVGYRYPWRPAAVRPTGELPVVPPRDVLPADWQRRFHCAVAYIREPIRIYRHRPASKPVVRRLWAELMEFVGSLASGGDAVTAEAMAQATWLAAEDHAQDCGRCRTPSVEWPWAACWVGRNLNAALGRIWRDLAAARLGGAR